jgi:hypothetical protein
MNQFSSEAEQEKVEELRAARRRKIFRSIVKTFLLLLLVGATAAGFHYRSEVNAMISRLTSKLPASPYANAEGKTKAKVADIEKQAAKRDQTLEDTYK